MTEKVAMRSKSTGKVGVYPISHLKLSDDLELVEAPKKQTKAEKPKAPAPATPETDKEVDKNV